MASALELIDRPIACPQCSKPAILRKDDQGYWVECEGNHRPTVNILPETALQALGREEVKP